MAKKSNLHSFKKPNLSGQKKIKDTKNENGKTRNFAIFSTI